MKFLLGSGVSIVLFFVLIFATSADAQTTEITYQGQLQNGGAAATGNFDFEFLLFDQLTGGTQIGSTLPRNGVAVANGIFSVKLDFGSNYPGANRFLEIHVRQTGGGGFTPLTPRQAVSSTPYSVKSLTSDNATNAASADTLSAACIGCVTGPKIASGQIVKSLNTLKDDVTLAQGNNITITPAGNTLTIASTSGGVVGSGTPNKIPVWNGVGTTLTDSTAITQNGNGVQLPNGVQLAAGIQGNNLSFGSPNGETGLSITSLNGPRADLRFDGMTVKLVARPTGSGPPSETNGIVINTVGNVGIGTNLSTTNPNTKLTILTSSNPNGIGIESTSDFIGVSGEASGGNGSAGVSGRSSTGYGVLGYNHGSGFGVFSDGLLGMTTLGTAGGTPLCRNASNQIATCSSSLRYKTDLQAFDGGMSVINRLRPITFKWKADKTPDVGFGAEDVAQVEPLLITHNDKGEVEGVKYDRLSVVFVNAFKEQQAQIKGQQQQIDELKHMIVQQRVGLRSLRLIVNSRNPRVLVGKRRR